MYVPGMYFFTWYSSTGMHQPFLRITIARLHHRLHETPTAGPEVCVLISLVCVLMNLPCFRLIHALDVTCRMVLNKIIMCEVPNLSVRFAPSLMLNREITVNTQGSPTCYNKLLGPRDCIIYGEYYIITNSMIYCGYR